jgi:hypothetical protein
MMTNGTVSQLQMSAVRQSPGGKEMSTKAEAYPLLTDATQQQPVMTITYCTLECILAICKLCRLVTALSLFVVMS